VRGTAAAIVLAGGRTSRRKGSQAVDTTTASSIDPADAELVEGLTRLGRELPFNRHLGVAIAAIDVGRCETVLPADERLHNHLGGVHAIAELAPVELAGALAASTRLLPLLRRGYVPVVGALTVRYRAPARGELLARAVVGEEVVAPALAAADAGERPRVEVAVEVVDAAGVTVVEAELRFVYVPVDPDAADRAD
jgi:acyl-coenzyme A thioesterase PaaI-like protein